MNRVRPYKIPESVLVVIYTRQLDVLLLERADYKGFWQSVTGSKDTKDEPLLKTALREVKEETGIAVKAVQMHDWQLSNIYEIYPAWRHRYAPGVTRNTEHVFGLCLFEAGPVTINPREHVGWRWLSHLAAADTCCSSSNAEAILLLPRFIGRL